MLDLALPDVTKVLEKRAVLLSALKSDGARTATQSSAPLLMALTNATLVHDAIAAAESLMSPEVSLPGRERNQVLYAWAQSKFALRQTTELENKALQLIDDSRADELLIARIALLAGISGELNGQPSVADWAEKWVGERFDLASGPTAVVADLARLRSQRKSFRDPAYSKAEQDLDLAISIYRLLGEYDNLTRCLISRAVVLKSQGLLEGAQRAALEAAHVSANSGSVPLLFRSLIQVAVNLYRTGMLAAAIECLDAISILDGHVSHDLDRTAYRLASARTLLFMNRAIDAATTLDEAKRFLDRVAAPVTQALYYEYRGMVCLNQQEASKALATFEHAAEVLKLAKVHSYERSEIMLRRAEAFVELQRFPDAYEECTDALQSLERVGAGLERGHLLRVKGISAYQMGRPREAGELFEHSERELRRVGDLYELGRLLADRAELLTDDAESRVSDAAEAVNLFERMGVEHLLERARDLLAVAQIALRRSQSITVAKYSAPEDKVVASSPAMLSLLEESRTVARTEGPALILGDTGSGKEVLARFVHENSVRGGKDFVAVNCAAIPETLFEREFFGHARGAFTGAERDRPGLVDLADGGTMFLDEIGEMPIAMQPKLLRLLQEGTYRRVGENRERHVDVRFVAATNRDLMEQVRDKTFRADLYYRLAWFELLIPPLRERLEDLVDLAKYFLARESQRSGITYWIHKEAWQVLKRFEWPGNVRQLESAVAGACARAGTNSCIRVEDLPPSIRKGIELRASPAAGQLNFTAQIESKERELILEALRRSDFHRTQAAKVLGIGRNTLYEKMKKLGIRPERSN